jgi:hypothetical protein
MNRTAVYRREPSNLGGRVAMAVAALTLGALLCACSHSSSPSGDAATTAIAPIPTPMATSIETADGTWSSIPMGHLDQPLNTFWQLFFLPSGSSTWSNQVEATAVATNGGIVLASDGHSLLAGIRPSNLLTYSPLIDTSDAGNTWSNGLLTEALTAHPNALAVNANGQGLALVNGPGSIRVLSSDNLSTWRTLVSEPTLAASIPGRDCGLASIDALAYSSGEPVVGAQCSRPGVVGIFADDPGGWRLVGPLLPSSRRGAGVEVLSLDATDTGLSALLGVSDPSGTSLVGATTANGGVNWALSPAFRLKASEQVASFGPAPDAGFFVLSSGPSGDNLEVLDGPNSTWAALPPPPTGTATVAFGPAPTVDALVVDQTVMTVWTLSTGSSSGWVKGQVVNVPIQFGSSS